MYPSHNQFNQCKRKRNVDENSNFIDHNLKFSKKVSYTYIYVVWTHSHACLPLLCVFNQI